MAGSCSYIPKRNGETLDGWFEYKKALGYEKASKVFSASIAPSYIEENKDILQLDSQGVPTLASTIRTPSMKRYLSQQDRIEVLRKQYNFTTVNNTAENFRMLVNEAKNFNTKESDFTAYVERNDQGIAVSIYPKSDRALQMFNNQYGSMVLNDRLIEIFEPLGITPELLTEAERIGSTGITDFSKAKLIAGQFKDLIKIAQGLEGQMAMSEEFSHIIIRALIDHPLVQRLINAYSSNTEAMREVLREEYESYINEYTDEEGNIDYDSIAEECVGRKLQEQLLNNHNVKPKNFFEKLIERLKKYIYSIVKNFNSQSVENAIIESDQTLDSLAKSILTGSLQLSQRDIENTRTDKIMHHLEATVNSLDKIIEQALIAETKKTHIFKKEELLNKAKIRESALKAIQVASPAGQLRGLLNYAKAASDDLRQTEMALRKASMDDTNVFSLLRSARMTLQSYTPFVEQLGELLRSNNEELVNLIKETAIENPDHTVDSIQSLFDDLNSLNVHIKGRFESLALDAFENFLKQFFDKEVFIDKHGKEQTLREAIEEANGDISFIDRWLQTMSTSGDIILQLFNKIVQKSKHDARIKTINDIRDIMLLQDEAEKAGITDFEYFFEKDNEGHKTGNYISEVNYGQYRKDFNDMIEALDKKYGENPRGEQSRLKAQERKTWLRAHAQSILEGDEPNANVYHNSEYDKLSPKQKEILQKYLAIKRKFDKRYPKNRVNSVKAIQRRKTQTERRLDRLKGPKALISDIQESFEQDFLESADDDLSFGQKTGLRDFSGREHMVLPILYSRTLKNPDDLSTDVFGSLSAYSYASNVYHELDKVVDPLEVGRQIVNEQRKNAVISKDKPVVEKLGKGAQILSKIFQTGSSNIEAKLQDFMESQVYGRYYKDSDTVFKVGKKNIKVNKAINAFLSISSVAQLGFNVCANLANLATGIAMQNIEAACGQFFGGKVLLKADGIYSKELLKLLPELESRNQKSKLALFDELFDVKQDFKDKAGRSRINGLLKRMFGETVAFIGQTCGDHWLYNRTAIALALNTKVIVDGKETSLWDALRVENKFKGNDDIKVLRVPKGTKDARTGRIIDTDWIGEWSEGLKYINHRLFGVYNSDDMVAAERTASGRMLLQFRKWIMPQMAARFDGKNYILAINEYTEGYYRTALNFMIGLKNGQGNIMQQWRDLDDWQRANVKRSLFEITQFMSVWILSQMLLGGAKDPDKHWARKLAEYMVQREVHELGNLTPSFTMGREILKTIQSPISAITSAQSVLNLAGSIIDPRDWNNVLQTGAYEGHSTLYKHLMKAPLPILPQVRQMDRFLNNLDEATLYYTRSY